MAKLMDDFRDTRAWRNFVSKIKKDRQDMPLEVLDYISLLEGQIQSLERELDDSKEIADMQIGGMNGEE